MTVADTNVRPAWRSPAATARGTRRFGLARLLLKQSGRLLRKLDLTLLLLFAVAPTPACIIPVGPDWHDPYGAPNAPPQILDPAPGEVAVTTIPTQPINFRIVVTDVNVNDDLEIKWFVDTDERFHLLPLVKHTGTQLRVLADKTVTCSDISPPNRGLPSHVVRAVVADRPIVGVDPLTITAPGLFDDRFWTLNMACQQ